MYEAGTTRYMRIRYCIQHVLRLSMTRFVLKSRTTLRLVLLEKRLHVSILDDARSALEYNFGYLPHITAGLALMCDGRNSDTDTR